MNAFRIVLILLVAVFTGACATGPRIPDPQPSWKQVTGQVQSTGGKTPIVGDIVIRYDDENFLAEISKGPGLPLLKLYAIGRNAEQVTARGALARGSWSGMPAEAPEALQAWVALPEVFHWARMRAAGDKSYSIRLQGVTTGGRRAGDELTYMEFERGGEKIICRFAR